MKKFSLLIGTIAFFAGLLCAADPSGKWSGAFPLNGNSVPLTFNLKADGETLTGTVGGLPTQNAEIKDGKVKDNQVTFTVTTDYQGNPVQLMYTGKVSDEQIDFTMATVDGSWSVTFAAKKATS